MNERIKKLRKALGLTQQEFAEQLNIGRGTLANYEVGRNEPIDAVIALICREFCVSDTWLRTGEGEMFVKLPEEDKLAATVERLVTGESAEFKRRLVNALSALTDKQWLLLEAKLKEIVGVQDAEEPDLAAKVAKLERQNQELAAKVAAIEEEDARMEVAEELSPGNPCRGTKTG